MFTDRTTTATYTYNFKEEKCPCVVFKSSVDHATVVVIQEEVLGIKLTSLSKQHYILVSYQLLGLCLKLLLSVIVRQFC